MQYLHHRLLLALKHLLSQHTMQELSWSLEEQTLPMLMLLKNIVLRQYQHQLKLFLRL
jgi:hypothetical protein